MRILPLLVCLVTAGPAVAETVYKHTQPDGTVVYSDRPTEGAEEIRLPEIQFYTAPQMDADALSRGRSREGAEDTGQGYDSVRIASPADDETVRDNGGNVSISLSLEPSLRPGHTIDIRMDGTSIGRGTGTSVALTNVDRGSHTVQAVILDENGREIASTGTITFHLRRVTKLLP